MHVVARGPHAGSPSLAPHPLDPTPGCIYTDLLIAMYDAVAIYLLHPPNGMVSAFNDRHTIAVNIERVQCRATKYTLNDYTSCYKTRLIKLRHLP